MHRIRGSRPKRTKVIAAKMAMTCTHEAAAFSVWCSCHAKWLSTKAKSQLAACQAVHNPPGGGRLS